MEPSDQPRTTNYVFPPKVLAGLGVASLVLLTVLHWSGNFSFEKTGDAAQRITKLYVIFCLSWFIACSLTGWIRRARKKLAPPGARTWPLYAPLIASGLTVSAIQAWDAVFSWPKGVPAGPGPSLWIAMILAAWPLFVAGILTFYLAIQARLWIARPDPSEKCPICAYNLQGNQSGRCPECGTPVESDANIPRSFYKSTRQWWIPELAEFPNAGARYRAWQSAMAEEKKFDLESVLLLVAIAGMAIANWYWESDQWEWMSMFILLTLIFVFSLGIRRRVRRRLRRYLAESRDELDVGQ